MSRLKNVPCKQNCSKVKFQVTFYREHLTYFFRNFGTVCKNIEKPQRNRRKTVEKGRKKNELTMSFKPIFFLA